MITIPLKTGTHIYILNPETRKIDKVYQGIDGDKLIVIYPEGKHAGLVVSIPIIEEKFLSLPTNLETNKKTRLTSEQWEQAYQLLGE